MDVDKVQFYRVISVFSPRHAVDEVFFSSVGFFHFICCSFGMNANSNEIRPLRREAFIEGRTYIDFDILIVLFSP